MNLCTYYFQEDKIAYMEKLFRFYGYHSVLQARITFCNIWKFKFYRICYPLARSYILLPTALRFLYLVSACAYLTYTYTEHVPLLYAFLFFWFFHNVFKPILFSIYLKAIRSRYHRIYIFLKCIGNCFHLLSGGNPISEKIELSLIND